MRAKNLRHNSAVKFRTNTIISVFLLLMCVSFYIIANDYKLKSAEAKNNILELKQINEALTKRGFELSSVIANEQIKAKLARDMVSREYEDRINYYEAKTIEFQQRIDELYKQKDEISDKISATILPMGESYAYNETEQVLSFPESGDALGGPAAYDNLEGIFGRLESDIESQEENYGVMLNRVYSSAFTGTGVKLALSRGVTRENIPTIWPVSGRITSWFGNRQNPFGGSGVEGHNGVDVAVNTGTPVIASGGGTVKFSGLNGGYGYLVVIDHGNGLESYYGHNSQLKVSEGQTVCRGQVISLSGNTGRSTGPHVHFEIRLTGNVKDPMDFIK